MMKSFIKIATILVAGIMMTACSKTPKLDTETFSYAATVSFAEHLAFIQDGAGIELDKDMVAKAIEDGLAGKSKMSTVDAEAAVSEFLNITLPAYVVYTAEQFMEKASKQRGAVKTNSGLVYKIIKEGDVNNKPNTNSVVTTTYICKNKDGKTILEVAQPETVVIRNHVAGVIEGLQQIGKGGEIKLWLPAKLAFGSNGNDEIGILGNEAISMEIKLLNVE